MPLPKAKDFREKTEEELAKDLANFGKEIATLPDTKYGRKQSLKKLVARILTVLNERSRKEKANVPKDAVKAKAAEPKKQPIPAKQRAVSDKARPFGAKGAAKAPRQVPKAATKAKK